jgi:hypothetical protein
MWRERRIHTTYMATTRRANDEYTNGFLKTLFVSVVGRFSVSMNFP